MDTGSRAGIGAEAGVHTDIETGIGPGAGMRTEAGAGMRTETGAGMRTDVGTGMGAGTGVAVPTDSRPDRREGVRRKALKAAFPHTIPIFAGFWFLGMTYGIYMNVSGFSFVYPLVMSLLIFGGSLEFLAVSMLLSRFVPMQTLIVALMIQARHLFYGIAMLDRFKGMGWKKPYLIFGMCDESFSINYSAKIPEDVDKGWFMFFVTLLDQLYWVTGATLGGILGSLITFDTKGLDFVMTAMFVVIFLEQWLKEKKHYTAYIGLGASALCLCLFGPDRFMIPAMVCILAGLTLFRRQIERAGGLV